MRSRTPNTGPPDRLAHPGRRIVAVAISPSSSVQRARQELAERLREIRLDAGLTARALSVAAGWHEAKTSRIEAPACRRPSQDLSTGGHGDGTPVITQSESERIPCSQRCWVRAYRRIGAPRNCSDRAGAGTHIGRSRARRRAVAFTSSYRGCEPL